MKGLNTNTKKCEALKQFIKKNVKDATSVSHFGTCTCKDGYLFEVYRKNTYNTFVKISYEIYNKHKGDWDDMFLEDTVKHIGYGWYGHEIVHKPIGETLLANI